MAKYHGKGGVLYLAAAGGGAASLVSNLTQWTISIQADKAEVTSLGDSFKSYVRGVKGGTISAQGFWADDADVPFDAFDADAKVAAYLYPAAGAPSKFWSGYVWPDQIDCGVQVGGAATANFSGTFDGTISRA